jgi:hypothetical protein
MMGGLLLVGSVGVAIERSSVGGPTGLSESQSVASAKAHTPAPAAAALAPDVMFSDNFERDPMGADPPNGWTIADGRWNGVISNDTHVVQHAAGPYGHLVAGSIRWADYTVSADVMPTPLRTSFAAVAGRYQDPGDYYQCDLHHANSLQLWRLRGGTQTLLDNRPVAIDSTHFSNLRLVMKGDQLSCVLNGVLLFTAVDHSLTNGQVALIAGDNEAAEFDNVTVTTHERTSHRAAVGGESDPRLHQGSLAHAGGVPGDVALARNREVGIEAQRGWVARSPEPCRTKHSYIESLGYVVGEPPSAPVSVSAPCSAGIGSAFQFRITSCLTQRR